MTTFLVGIGLFTLGLLAVLLPLLRPAWSLPRRLGTALVGSALALESTIVLRAPDPTNPAHRFLQLASLGYLSAGVVVLWLGRGWD